MASNINALRADLLKQHGFVGRGMGRRRGKRILLKTPNVPLKRPFKGKTMVMREVERVTGKSIEELLSLDRKGGEIAAELGLHPTTVSRWRAALGIVPKRGRPY